MCLKRISLEVCCFLHRFLIFFLLLLLLIIIITIIIIIIIIINNNSNNEDDENDDGENEEDIGRIVIGFFYYCLEIWSAIWSLNVFAFESSSKCNQFFVLLLIPKQPKSTLSGIRDGFFFDFFSATPCPFIFSAMPYPMPSWKAPSVKVIRTIAEFPTVRLSWYCQCQFLYCRFCC